MKSSHTVAFFVIGFSFLAAEARKTEAQILPSMPPQSTSNVQQAGGDVDGGASGEVQQTGWPKLTLPKVTMPKVTMPNLSMPDMSKMLSPVSSGFQKISAGSQKAWAGTKEMFSFGKTQSASRTSNPRAKQPNQSIWQRLIGRSPEPAAPQTVGEWMSQPRLDP